MQKKKAKALISNRRVNAVNCARERRKQALLDKHTNKLQDHIQRKRQHLRRRSAEAAVDLEKIKRYNKKMEIERQQRRKSIDTKLALAAHKRETLRSGQMHRRNNLEQEMRRLAVLAARDALNARSEQFAIDTVHSLVEIDPTPPTTPNLNSEALYSDAAAIIQNAWRKWYFLEQMIAFSKTSFANLVYKSIAHSLEKPSFEDVSAIIQEKESILACQALLKKLWAVLPAKSKNTSDSISPKLGTRMLMSSIMIVHYPDVIFSDCNGDIEKIVRHDANLLVNAFAAWTSAEHTSRRAFRDLIKTWYRYKQTFKAWKDLDSARIIQGLVDTYIELNALKESVQISAEPTKIDKLGDPLTCQGKKVISSAVPQVDEWLPKILSQQNAIRHRLKQLGAEHAIVAALEFQSIARQAHLSKKSGCGDEVAKNGPRIDYSNDSDKIQKISNSPDKKTNPSLIDARLAREIIANPNFSLQKKCAKDGLQFQVKEIAEKAFYDLLREELAQDPPCCRRIPNLVSELRDELTNLVSETDSARLNDIRGLCDPDFISQQIEKRVFNAPQYMKGVTTVLSNMCCPSRDVDVENLITSKDIADFFQKCFSVIESMKLDMANFRIQCVRPYLTQIGISYERQKFQDCLESGDITLDRTIKWLKKSIESLGRDDITPSPANCVERGYLNLLKASSFVKDANNESKICIPETLEMDKIRIDEWNLELECLSLGITIRTLLYTAIPKLSELSLDLTCAILDIVRKFVHERKNNNEHSLAKVIFKIASEAVKETQAFNMTQRAATLFYGQIDACLSGQSPVMKILNSRINSYIADCIRSADIKYGSQKYTLPQPHPSLEAIWDDLSAVAFKIAYLTTHNRSVHQHIYDDILKTILA